MAKRKKARTKDWTFSHEDLLKEMSKYPTVEEMLEKEFREFEKLREEFKNTPVQTLEDLLKEITDDFFNDTSGLRIDDLLKDKLID